jgi:hypothetical protein
MPFESIDQCKALGLTLTVNLMHQMTNRYAEPLQ